MKFVRRGLAILLAVLLVIPGSPVSVERVLLTEAAEADKEPGTETATGAETTEPEVADFVDSLADEGLAGEAAGVEEGAASLEDFAISLSDADAGKNEVRTEESIEVGEDARSTETSENPAVAEEGADSSELPDGTLGEVPTEGLEGNAEPEDGNEIQGSGESLLPSEGSLEEEVELNQALENLPMPYAEGIVASGADRSITWTLDSNGLLTISGAGDYDGDTDNNSNLWGDYRDSITSAKVDVTGMTNTDGMFAGCHNLTSLNLTGFDTSNVACTRYMFYECSSLTSLDLSDFDTSNVTDMSAMFYGCSSLTSLDLSSFDTSNVTNMWALFFSCENLTSLDLGRFDTRNVTNMSLMFANCSGLTSLDMSSFDTANVINMEHMFSGCSGLTSLDLSNFNTGNVIDMYGMFWSCGNLSNLDLRNFDTSNVIDMGNMFAMCSNLINLDMSNFNTSNVANMNEMFWNCENLSSLDLSHFDTSNVTSMESMFSGCDNLASLDMSSFNTSKVTDMSWMFFGCSGLTELRLENFDTSSVTSMYGMFLGCESLTSLELGSFDTKNVTDMSYMFSGCNNLVSLGIGNFNTSNVTLFSCMFQDCSSLSNLELSNFDTRSMTTVAGMFDGCSNLRSLDLSSFDMGNVDNNIEYATEMLSGCGSLTTINAPRNLSRPTDLPIVEGTAWYLPDGTQITQLPQNLSESVLIERRDTETLEPADIWFRVTGATGHSQYADLYIAENSDQNILDTFFDPLYENAYQTLFINDSSTDLANLAPTFESSADTEIHVLEQGQQISGQSTQDFSKGNVIYSAIQYTNADKTAFLRRDYTVAFAKKESGPRLFVNGPAERQIFLTDYFQNQHDILIANVGDGQLTGIHAELLDAVNIKLDDSQPVESALAAFDRIPGQGQEASDVMANLGKVRLVPDGEGEISGTLKITADGQEPVYIVLTGYSDNPRITTTTAELNMDDVIRVKYVPYSYTVETNNRYDWNRVTFSVEESQLARGLQMYPATGEIYGVPLEAGEFNITVKATFSRPEFLPSYAQLTLIVKDNTDANVNVATDSDYDLIQRVQDIVLGTSDSGSQTMVSLGDYAEFKAVYLDGERLAEGTDYDSESGSTRITIRAQTLTGKGVGSHTLGIEFRTQDTNALRRAAQNYTVVQTGTGGSGNGGSHSGGAGSGADYNAVAEVSETVIYTVQPGDSLWRIAARFYGTGALWRRIYEDNIVAIRNPDRIYAGQRLVIRLADSDRAGRGAVAVGTGRRIYSVMLGDNLWTVAKKVYGNGMLWERIYRANRELILDARQIYAGQRIVIPAEE